MRLFQSFPIAYQHDGMQCGVACLKMVCEHFGRKYSLDALSHVCFATTEGVSMLGISESAKKLGIKTICVKATIDSLATADMPCILHWNQNHFVVLYKVRKGRKFYVADPGKGLVTYSRADFKRHWVSMQTDDSPKGIAMFVEPAPEFLAYQMPEEWGDEGEQRSFRFLLGYFKKYRKSFALIFLSLVVGSLIQLALPFLTQAIVDNGIKNKSLDLIWLILLGQLMLTVSRTVIDFIRSWALLRINMKINISLLSDFFKKLLKLPMSFFDTKLLGDLMQRMGDHDRVNSFLTQKTLNVAFSLITFVVFGVVLFLYDKVVFGVFLLGSIVYGLWMQRFLHRRKLLDYELFEQQSHNNNKTYEFITSMQEIKLQDCEQRKCQEWKDVQVAMFGVQAKSLKLQQTQQAGSIFINEVKNILITVVAATSVIHGEMTLGMMLAVQYIIGQLNSPIEQLMNFFYSLQDVKISLERINEIHRKKGEDEEPGLLTSVEDKTDGLALYHVDFKYDPHSTRKTLDDVSFFIPYGHTTAIVGESGSGKTTLLKLLLGYYPVSKGELSVGNTNINKINKKWWRRQCGVVMQDGVIFSDTITRNIAVGDGEVDMDRVMVAARVACIHDYVITLPLGYDTKIGRDGVGLSQGQKQRILIARAVYKDPGYIFLDEATNSLDTFNERMIVDNLNWLYEHRTVVVVAHRLSTVKNAHQIIVMNRGRVVEVGNHESLVKLKGYYYNLVRQQLDIGN